MIPSDAQFSAFLAEHESRVHRALLATFGPLEGRSAAQAAMDWAWEHWDRVGTLSNVPGYLYRVGATAATRNRPREVVTDRAFGESVTMDPSFDPDLVAQLDRLSPRQRASVVLVHGHGYTLRDAGAVLGLNPSTVRIHVQRGLRTLRRVESTRLGVRRPAIGGGRQSFGEVAGDRSAQPHRIQRRDRRGPFHRRSPRTNDLRHRQSPRRDRPAAGAGGRDIVARVVASRRAHHPVGGQLGRLRQGARSGNLDWLHPGDEGLYFLDTIPAANTPYGQVIYSQTSAAARILNGADGSAGLPDRRSPATAALVGLTFDHAIVAVTTAIARDADAIAAAAAAKAEQRAQYVPDPLPEIVHSEVLARLQDSAGTAYELTMAERQGHFFCYSLAPAGATQPLDTCFSRQSFEQAQPATQMAVLPLGSSRVIIGFTHEKGVTSGTSALGDGRSVTFDLQRVPGFDNLRFFAVPIDADLQPEAPQLA